jgi:protocatechuate 3,4-dioxygenase beta subunit
VTVAFEVHGRFERLVTRMYFPGEPLNASDRLLNSALRPDLLIAASLQDQTSHSVLNADIVVSRR